MAAEPNLLFYGDNLDVLRRHVVDESVDLVYLDPPFNSNRAYNVLFRSKSGDEAQAQIEAFDDTWTWSQQSEEQYLELIQGGAPNKVADALEAMRRLLGDNDVLAYLVMMTTRLLELHRVLKPTGSLYLHCDPTASHYLKVMLDAIFGPTNFRNEIVWRRTGAHTTPKRFETIHDTLLFYARDVDRVYFHPLKRPYTKQHVESRYEKDDKGRLKFVTGGNILTGPGATAGESGAPWHGFDPTARGRHWAIPGYLAEQMPPGFEALGTLAKLDALLAADLIEIKKDAAWPHPVKFLGPDDGTFIPDIWAYQPGTEGDLFGTDFGIDADVQWLGPTSPERLGFQTQKPRGLLERIIRSSCPDDGVVLDPFCGCGTTVEAAQSLGRRWIGMDITYLAVDLIENRFLSAYGPDIKETYEVRGIPQDLDGARALFAANPFDFERWAVSRVDGQPNQRQVGDRGIDGVIKFPIDKRSVGRALVSVKGGGHVGPSMLRDLVGAVDQERAELGVFLCMATPTAGMRQVADRSGTYEWPLTGKRFPLIQILTVEELLADQRPDMPTPFVPYVQAKRLVSDDQLTLGL